MRINILIIFLIFSTTSFSQKRNLLQIQLNKIDSKNDSFSIYELNISNYSDSITCILHSPAIFLGLGGEPQELAVTEKTESNQFYNLKLSMRDTIYINEVNLYRSSIILPYQSLLFKIRVPISSKKQLLSIDYFRLPDISYQKFEKEMEKGRWYEKYHQFKNVILLP